MLESINLLIWSIKNEPKLYELNNFRYLKRFRFNFDKIDYSKLKKIKQSFPFWELIDWNLDLLDDLEIVTNPFLYQNGVQSFIFHNWSAYISDKFVANIREIKPKYLCIESSSLCQNQLNLIDILSELPSKMKITFKWRKQLKPITLWFSNVILKVFQNDRDDFMLFEWKSFMFKISQNYLKDIKVEHLGIESYLDMLVLNLDHYLQIEFEDITPILNNDQALNVDEYFLQYIQDSKSNWEILVRAKDIARIDVKNSIVWLEDLNGNVEWLTLKWAELKNYFYELTFPYELEYLPNLVSLLPQTWKYTILLCLDELRQWNWI